MSIYFIVILALVLAYLILILVKGKKLKEYTIYQANSDVFLVYLSFRKSFLDYWWGFINFKGMREYRDKDGKRIWVSERYTMKIVEDENPEARLEWIKKHAHDNDEG